MKKSIVYCPNLAGQGAGPPGECHGQVGSDAKGGGGGIRKDAVGTTVA
jgi:hypothetical protein